MENKHTHSKWELQPDSPYEIKVIEDGWDIATVSSVIEGYELDEEDWQRAYLIRSAPDLLEALQELQLALDKYCIPDSSEELTRLNNKAKQAINKATGNE